MQFRRRTTSPGSAPHSQGSFVGKPNERPEWLKEWIANRGSWVELVCGHKADLNERGQINLEGETKGDMLTICVQCWQFVSVKCHLTYCEYRGITAAVIPEEPLF